ncbi:hypothetical protein VTN77DRAFT_6528 [Rasamsonia byssochlamydoides]|uniref:uncharacterized protein n=1 Tax=Rasamsonia byssochlamydoides TaxID=89139 RepID=UPI0037434558
MTPRRIHIAVLDTDVPVPTVYAARGLYSSQFRVLLQAAAARLNASGFFPANRPVEVRTTAYDVVGGALPHLSLLRTQPRSEANEENGDEDRKFGPSGPIDAVLITGSSASAYRLDRYPWIAPLQSFIQTVYAEYPEVRIFGSCFGHQIVAQALLSRHHPRLKHEVSSSSSSSSNSDSYAYVSVAACPVGYEVGIHPITLNPAFVRCFPALESCLPRQGHGQLQWKLQLIHGDRVTLLSPELQSDALALPSPWLNLGSTPKSPIQGLYHPGRVLTYQGHFEFDAWVNRETCIEFARREGWSESDIASYLRQIGPAAAAAPGEEGTTDDDDSKIAAEVVVMFLAGVEGDVDVDDDKQRISIRENAVSRNGLITPPLGDADAEQY